MVVVVYSGSYDEVKKKLDAIVAREARKGLVLKGEYVCSHEGRVFMGTVSLAEVLEAAA